MSQTPSPESQAAVVVGIQNLVLDIARALVDDPEAVSVEIIAEGESTMIRLRVSQKDVGKIIGKQGRTARSLRTILGAASMKLHHRFSLDILEVGESPRASGQAATAPSQEDL